MPNLGGMVEYLPPGTGFGQCSVICIVFRTLTVIYNGMVFIFQQLDRENYMEQNKLLGLNHQSSEHQLGNN